ncbi:MAG TPA: dynamin family protein [Pseudogracilibacillus sp.]|nr:dynamin family protein [Pseudogracilibacillus sp.]
MLEKTKTNVTEGQLASLYHLMREHKDEANANKILDLYEKLTNNHFHVSFTGHFSAGKSSIINYLLEKELLPKSPIPTSANIVKITSGAGVARVFFNEQNPVEYDEPYDIDMIKDYCMNKDTINQIEIHTSDPIVPEHTYIVDTPGIDAADDADRYMTESSLHLVDVLYYVMDYNHVQSEINFTFLKQIQDKNIPIYLIINQVDKHNEKELSFEQFAERVEDSFKQWSIYPERIYYSSVMKQDLSFNELSQIKEDLFHLLHHHEAVGKQVSNATEQIIASHRELLEESLASASKDVPDGAFDEAKWNDVLAKIEEIEQREQKFEAEYMDEIDQTLKNAYLMPAKLRELAHDFLESQDASFKVGGLFGAKKKTAEAKEARLDAFYQALNQSMQTTIIWKLREKLAQIIQDYQIANEELRDMAQNYTIEFTKDDLFNSLKDGAQVNGQYVLNYTNELSNQIKTLCKRKANDMLAEMKAELAERAEEEVKPLVTEREQLAVLRESSLAHSNLEAELTEKMAEISAVLSSEAKDKSQITIVNEQLATRYHFVKEDAYEVEKQIAVETEKEKTIDEAEDDNHMSKRDLSSEEIIANIDKTIAQISDLADFESLVADLQAKKTKIEDRSLTIALFGAFSAGKSSFSNALLGERVLPVSPNPTTAVINRIRPITDQYKSGTVVISYKSDHVLTDDLKNITKEFLPEANNFIELVEWIKREKMYENEQLSHVYQAYLLAILDGYNDRKDLLGKEEQISLDDFAAYVTDESIAAYIEAVDLYYDNALTRNGITLVDTPGANSVNARHTNVAFDYIKDADAILYVTYYNHAVTSADRDFLIQLGRVKESFELDKMFFIVNAADLAADETELNLVLNYVEEQLLQYGIRNPQIYPLSSKLSLEQKEANEELNEQMASFESNFQHFVEHDLHALTYEAAIWDMKRAESRIDNVIQSAKLDEQAKETMMKDLETKRKEALNLIAGKKVANLIERTEERIERQLHFVKERVYIRFHDMFQEHFNPTTITENGRQAQTQLQANRNRLVDYVGYELLQEVRAVSLRLESYINKLFKDHYEQMTEELRLIDESMTIANFEEERFTTPEYAQAFTQINMALFQNALKVFKNLRSYFEQNEREQMKELFYDALEPEIVHYLNEQQLIMQDDYLAQLTSSYEQILNEIKEEVTTIVTHQITMLTTEIDYESYANKLEQVSSIVSQLDR